MSSYQRRLIIQQARTAAERERMKEARSIQVEPILRRYEEAYKAFNNRPIRLKYVKGWAVVQSPGFYKYRLSELERMTAVLEARVHEMDLTS